eukprot:TRINITY_DN2095_c0_g2_i2.p1 TRINITY_DN2095_c0_g2~~TRINITY_DN2095_c0_g2_i2.p1  ORF type:complete len:2522 (+),score=807.37 TRINITY_DN2095_c0_g2_i2:103-7668(+)
MDDRGRLAGGRDGEPRTRWRRSGALTAALQPHSERNSKTMTGLIAALRTQDDHERAVVQKALRAAMEDVKHGPAEEFARVREEVNQLIRRHVENEQDPQEQLAGIAAIEALVDLVPTAAQFAQFGNHLRLVLRHTERLTSDIATRTLGQLARVGGDQTADLVLRQTRNALEILESGEPREQRLYVSALVVKELALNVPVLFYQHVGKCSRALWRAALKDPSLIVREAAAEALRALLDLIASQSDGRSDDCEECLDQCSHALASRDINCVHGGLLCIGDIFLHTSYLYRRFKPTYQLVWSHRSQPHVGIRVQVLRLLAVIGRCNPEQFAADWLELTVQFLTRQFKRGGDVQRAEKAAAYTALADVAEVARGPFTRLCVGALQAVREAIHREAQEARQGATRFADEALVCYARLTTLLPEQARGQLEREMNSSQELELLFGWGASLRLAEALKIIIENFPRLESGIQDRMLQLLQKTLSGHAGTAAGAGQPPRAEDITRALIVCRNFGRWTNCVGHADLVRDHVMRYLDDENPTVRKEAALTCARIVVPLPPDRSAERKPKPVPRPAPHPARVRSPSQQLLVGGETRSRGSSQMQPAPLPPPPAAAAQSGAWGCNAAPTRGQTGVLVGEVVERLLGIAVTDPDPRIRLATFSSLDGRFANHLVTQDSLRKLFISLNDEVPEIRGLVTELVGRLAHLNPSYVLPCVRKQVLQLLTTLEHTVDLRSLEHTLRNITKLIIAAPQTMRQYTQGIVQSLKLRMPDLMEENGVAVAFLDALAAISEAVGGHMSEYLEDFLPLVIGELHDKSSLKKLISALRALAGLVQYTGFVIKPYELYPDLLPQLFSILRADSHPGDDSDKIVKREVVRVLGIIGALDPYHRNMQVMESTTALPEFVTYKSDHYFTKTAARALICIMKDNTLGEHHKTAVQALVNICLTVRPVAGALDQVLPLVVTPFVDMVRRRGVDSDLVFTKWLLAQLSGLVSLCKEGIRQFLPAFHGLIEQFFDTPPLLPVVLHLMANLAVACPGSFKAYLPPLLPRILLILRCEVPAEDSACLLRCLYILVCLREHLSHFLQQIIPVLMGIVTHEGSDQHTLRIAALRTLRRIGRALRLEDHTAAIIHPLLRIMQRPRESAPLKADISGVLCLLVIQLGSDFASFIPVVQQVLTGGGKECELPRYGELIKALLRNKPLPGYDGIDLDPSEVQQLTETLHPPLDDVPELKESRDAATDAQLLPVNAKGIVRAAQGCQSVVTRNGFVRWQRNFALELLNQSPHKVLRLCANLASQYLFFSRDLFNAAFVSVWTQMGDRHQEVLTGALERALTSPHLPTDVLGVLLNLVESLEANGLPMPLDPNLLSNLAHTKTHALAKALRWKEIAFQSAPQATIDELIRIYHTLGQQQSALGLLKVAQRDLDIRLKESWYEQLGRWEEALRAFDGEGMEKGPVRGHRRTVSEDVSQMQINRDAEMQTISAMRCLRALGEWKQLHSKCLQLWDVGSETSNTSGLRADGEGEEEDDGDSLQHAIAPLATCAAWHMGDWEFMADAVEKLVPSSFEYYFHKGVLGLRNQDDVAAQWAIENARDCVAQDLTALVGESYSRSYHCLVQAQQLAELEEIKWARTATPQQKSLLHTSWLARLRGCAHSVQHWHNILEVRTLLLDPVNDSDTWLKFAWLCRRQGQHHLEKRTLLSLLGHDRTKSEFDPEWLVTKASTYNPTVSLAFLKHLWAVGERKKAYRLLTRLVGVLRQSRDCPEHLLARCSYKLGDWYPETGEPGDVTAAAWYEQATVFDRDWYKAWHSYALVCQGAVSTAQKHQQTDLVVKAVRGYVRSITIGPNNSSVLQDVLRLLTLWFQFGNQDAVERALREGFDQVNLDVWLLVIPQIIARVQNDDPKIAGLVRWLLCRIGGEFPQALIWPLTVCARSTHQNRREVAKYVLGTMRQQSGLLLDECDFVSNELIRVAVVWLELWNSGLEEASKLFFGAKDTEGFLRVLIPLHKNMVSTDTLSEVSFRQQYGRDLQEAYEWCRSYLKSGDDLDIHQAWDLYYTVYKKVHKVVTKEMMTIELQTCSPRLFHARDLNIAMPGLPARSANAVRIKSFRPMLTVMPSKQRPRRMSIYGNDGVEYQFLLKANEDLRLDERVMQLFGLVNALLQSDGATAVEPALQIQRYSVIPLSSNVGLIGWVDKCDTLHALVKGFRERKSIRINVEYLHMTNLCSPHDAFDVLPLLNKVELFEHAMGHTTSQDLYKILWHQSGTAEVWNERRSTYTKSLATMSMVGYILGLGDRHPNNLMLQKVTGKIVHIDFGDCFEVAMLRDKYPEKIPFRLTRMLRNAMEVSGIEGNYRTTCEHVMRVLREHKGSVMAMLEAFIHDPLLQWRILRHSEGEKPPTRGEEEQRREEAEAKNLEMRCMIIEDMLAEAEAAVDPDDPAPVRRDRAAEEKELKSRSLEGSDPAGEASHKGVHVLRRIDDKLKGRDFDKRGRPRTAPNVDQIPPDDLDEPLSVTDQVDRLIKQATSVENLCQCYSGWCSFW